MNELAEMWMPIPGFDGYEISSHGRVRSFRSMGRSKKLLAEPKILRPVAASKKAKILLVIRQLGFTKENKPYAFQLHRLMWELFVGPIPEGIKVDHKDGNPLNNRLDNLRLATQQQNRHNSKPFNGKRFKGVFFDKRGSDKARNWYAQLRFKGQKTINLGCFFTEIEAARAYNEAAIKHHGEFAKLNILD